MSQQDRTNRKQHQNTKATKTDDPNYTKRSKAQLCNTAIIQKHFIL